MKLKIFFFILLSICILPSDGAKQNKRLIDKYAKRLAEFFNFEKLIKVNKISNLPSKMQNLKQMDQKSETNNQHIGCSSLQEITTYFFDVYSNDKQSFNMSKRELENLIEYLATDYPKDGQILNRTRWHKCNRKKCFQSKDISQLVNSEYFDYESFIQICPILLFNFEIDQCEYDHENEGLSGGQSKFKINSIHF